MNGSEAADDECLFHGPEPPRVTDYRVCATCNHRYRSRHAYVAAVHQVCAELGWPVVDDLPFCALCSADWEPGVP